MSVSSCLKDINDFFVIMIIEVLNLELFNLDSTKKENLEREKQ